MSTTEATRPGENGAGATRGPDARIAGPGGIETGPDSRRPRALRTPKWPLVALACCLLAAALSIWLGTNRRRGPRLATDYIVAGGKRYRRTVRVTYGGRAITTTVTFRAPNGGIGQATFVQPDMQQEGFFASVRRGFLRLLGRPSMPPRQLPVMIIPTPIPPGQTWYVRIVLTPHGMWTDGRGDHPRDARFNIATEQERQRGIVYGEGIADTRF